MGVRRQQGEGSIYQRSSDGRWVGVVDLGWVAGKRVRKSTTAATLRELRPKLARLKASIESGVIPDDVTVGQWLEHWLTEIAPAKNPHGSLSRDETWAMLDLLAAYGDDGLWDVASRYLAALLAGMRQGEALGLRWEDVDLAGEALHIERSVQRIAGRGLVVQPVKSARSVRRVPLMPPLHLALIKHRESAPDGYVWGGEKPTDPRVDWGRWKGLLWAAGCEDHPLHAARATTANILHEVRAPDRVIAAILGHANFEVTWTHYLSAEDRQLEAAMREGWAMLGAQTQNDPRR